MVTAAALQAPRPAAAQAASDEMPEAAHDVSELDLGKLLEDPEVAAASRRAQLLQDAPASVSVITADQIEAAGVNSLPDLLARVPGTYVVQTNANTSYVGLRGLNAYNHRNVLFLIDGRNAGDMTSGNITWGLQPLDPGDLETVEVIRGPGSTMYGAGAFSGVIAARTKRPIDHPGVEADAAAGVFAEKDDTVLTGHRAANGGRAYAAYNWVNEPRTFGIRLSVGANGNPEWGGAAPISPVRHGPFAYHASLAIDDRPDPDLTVFAQLACGASEALATYSTGAGSAPTHDQLQAFNMTVEKRNFLSKLLTLKFALDGRRETSASSGLAQSAAYLGHSLLQFDLELAPIASILTVAGEASVRKIDDYFTANVNSSYLALVAQDETRLLADGSLLLNAGVRAEQITSSDQTERVVYRNVNPRFALIYRLAEQHALRLAGATAYKSPSPFDNFVTLKTGAYASPLPPWSPLVANPRLGTEQVLSAELGYRGLLAGGLRLDTTIFVQRLENLIESPRRIAIPYQNINGPALNQGGVEAALDLALSSRTWGYLRYTFTKTGPADDVELGTWPQHLAALGLEQRLPEHLRLNADLDFTSAIRPAAILTAPNRLYTEVQFRDLPAHFGINLRLGRFVFDDRGEVYVAARNILGFFRNPDALRGFPDPVAQPIGGSVIAGLRIREL